MEGWRDGGMEGWRDRGTKTEGGCGSYFSGLPSVLSPSAALRLARALMHLAKSSSSPCVPPLLLVLLWWPHHPKLIVTPSLFPLFSLSSYLISHILNLLLHTLVSFICSINDLEHMSVLKKTKGREGRGCLPRKKDCL